MPSPAELQSMLPLFLQLLFFAVAGALIVGTFATIIGFMFRHALIIMILIILIYGLSQGFHK